MKKRPSLLTKLQKQFDHQRLMGFWAQFWSGMIIPIATALFSALGLFVADEIKARILRGVFTGLLLLAVSAAFAIFVGMACISTLDSVLHKRSRGLGKILSVVVASAPLLAAVFAIGYAVYVVARAIVLTK
jgi:hypothetical protein